MTECGKGGTHSSARRTVRNVLVHPILASDEYTETIPGRLRDGYISLASRRRPTTKEGNQSQIVRAAHAVYNISTDYPAPPSLSKKPSPHRTWIEGINGEKARIAWTDKCNQSTPSSLLKPPWPGEFVRPGVVAAVGLFILPINPEVGVPRPHRPFVTTFMARCSASARSC